MYQVVQGDHLAGIAARFGFVDYRSIWDHPENSALKKKRINPNILYPGDRLFVPTREHKEHAGATARRHRFRAKTPSLRLRIVLKNMTGKPLAGLECSLVIEGKPEVLVSNSDGLIEQRIAPADRMARLQFKDDTTPFGTRVAVHIGELDPVATPSGQIARLTNLGYFLGDPQQPDDMDVKSAIEEFQCEHPPLKVDGVCGAATQAKLQEAHGS